jgi:hypothetical protein
MRAARAAGAVALLGCARGAPAADGPRLCRKRRGARARRPWRSRQPTLTSLDTLLTLIEQDVV